MNCRSIFTCILFLALTANMFAQIDENEVAPISRVDQSEKFQELSQELDYNKTKKVWRLKETEKEDAEVEEPLNENEIEFRPKKAFNFNGSIADGIAYVLIIGLIAVVIYLVFSNVKIEKKIEDSDLNMMEIEDIEEVDTIDGFKKAITVSDYRSAIRMQFIKVLQMLQEGNHIHWRPEKTNRDYSRELNGTSYKSSFKELSGIYELVWYGNTFLDKNTFERLNPSFDKFINKEG